MAHRFSFAFHAFRERRGGIGFDMLLHVRKVGPLRANRLIAFVRSMQPRVCLVALLLVLSAALLFQLISPARNSAAQNQPQTSAGSATAATSAGQNAVPGATPAPAYSTSQLNILNFVVLDPAHGGTDPGARGTGGIRESEVVLEFTAQIRRALESQGMQVAQTRTGDENPSFDDRSALANARRGAVFVTIHIASTGAPGTARVYVYDDLPPITNPSGLIPWDQAQSPFLGLSRKLGDSVQSLLAQRFKGSPNTAQSAAVRQLRTTAAPAIAVEISSVSVEKREDLDRMASGVADAVARGIVMFKPSYVVATAAPATPAPIASASGVGR